MYRRWHLIRRVPNELHSKVRIQLCNSHELTGVCQNNHCRRRHRNNRPRRLFLALPSRSAGVPISTPGRGTRERVSWSKSKNIIPIHPFINGPQLIYTIVRIINNEELQWYLSDCLSLKTKFPDILAGAFSFGVFFRLITLLKDSTLLAQRIIRIL